MTTDKTDPADQRLFVCTDEQWDAFLAILNAPVKDMPKLAALLAERK